MDYSDCPHFSCEYDPFVSTVFDHDSPTYFCNKSGEKRETYGLKCCRCKELRTMSIMERVNEHLNEAYEFFPQDRVVGIFLQGSQNYGLEVPNSDVDTKLIVLPTFKEIAFNLKPHSTTHIRANEEHIDFKDIRLMIGTFRKQNLNFLEILFTDFKVLNPIYEKEWLKLVDANEAIAHYNPYQAIKSMKGIAMEKYHALKHPYPSKITVLEKYGYDPKQLHHLLRVEDYIWRYINGESYKSCLSPTNPDYLKQVKLGCFDLETAEKLAKIAIDHTIQMADEYTTYCRNEGDPEVDALLNEVQLNIMREATQRELIL